jgi:hypothetical protein
MNMKKVLYTVVCLYPLLLTIILLSGFILGSYPIDVKILQYVNFLFFIGLLFIFIKIWSYPLDKGWKLKWTLLILFFGYISLPVFWGKYVMGWGSESKESDLDNANKRHNKGSDL